jgi:hypothetical protein
MKDKDAKIFVISMKNISKELQYYGTSNINNINLLKLIYKYAAYFTDYEYLQAVDKMVNYLQRSDRRICMEFTYTKGYSYEYNTIDISGLNRAPTLSDLSLTVNESGDNLVITYDDMYGGYYDSEGTDPGAIIIKTIPANGTLYLNGTEISAGETISYDASLEIEYARNSSNAYSTSFTYSVYDTDTQVPLESNTATASLTIKRYVAENEPPTIGDLTLYADNRAAVTITVNDILYNADPSYSDPEGNQLDAIRIDVIATSNTGTYYYYGTEVVVNAIITYDDLVAGAFTYSAPDLNSIQTDIIEVSIRDTVNLEWVSS